jgi:hypothetical protein
VRIELLDPAAAAGPCSRRIGGRGLGLWVQATMLSWLLAERPEVTEIETWNGYLRIEDWVNYQLALP